MLLNPPSTKTLAIGLAAMAVVGALCAYLVSRGNPSNMGVCGACFLRDAAGSLGLVAAGPTGRPAAVRPELVGVVVGALALTLARGRFVARTGSHAASRFVLGAWTTATQRRATAAASAAP